MFERLKLPLNVVKAPKLRNVSGKNMKMHGVMTVKFKMENTIYTQEFVVCDYLVRPIHRNHMDKIGNQKGNLR